MTRRSAARPIAVALVVGGFGLAALGSCKVVTERSPATPTAAYEVESPRGDAWARDYEEPFWPPVDGERRPGAREGEDAFRPEDSRSSGARAGRGAWASEQARRGPTSTLRDDLRREFGSDERQPAPGWSSGREVTGGAEEPTAFRRQETPLAESAGRRDITRGPPTEPSRGEDRTVSRSAEVVASSTDELIEDIHRRLERRSLEVQWKHRDEALGEEIRELEQSLVALALLRPASEARKLPRATIESLGSRAEDGFASKLLAAAFLDRAGLVEERDEILRQVAAELADLEPTAPPGRSGTDEGQDAPPATDAASRQPAGEPRPGVSGAPTAEPPSGRSSAGGGRSEAEVPRPVPPEPGSTESSGVETSTASAFRLQGLRFATAASGRQKFEPRATNVFSPGEKTLIHGDFAGFEETVDRSGENPVYVRRFKASLTLLDEQGNLIDSGTFFGPERGTSRGPKPQDTLNFWAEYVFPASLSPGEYRLVIDAQDLVGGGQDSVSLPLRIRSASQSP